MNWHSKAICKELSGETARGYENGLEVVDSRNILHVSEPSTGVLRVNLLSRKAHRIWGFPVELEGNDKDWTHSMPCHDPTGDAEKQFYCRALESQLRVSVVCYGILSRHTRNLYKAFTALE